MFKYKKIIMYCFLLTILFPLNIKADSIVSINDLIQNAKSLDGKNVTIQGEVIGERLDRGDNTWVNINDGTNAIGVWMTKSDADKISNYGKYKQKGDTVKIDAVFNRACKEHGGEADVHNINLMIIDKGFTVKEVISKSRIEASLALAIIALISFILFYRKTKEMKQR